MSIHSTVLELENMLKAKIEKVKLLEEIRNKIEEDERNKKKSPKDISDLIKTCYENIEKRKILKKLKDLEEKENEILDAKPMKLISDDLKLITENIFNKKEKEKEKEKGKEINRKRKITRHSKSSISLEKGRKGGKEINTKKMKNMKNDPRNFKISRDTEEFINMLEITDISRVMRKSIGIGIGICIFCNKSTGYPIFPKIIYDSLVTKKKISYCINNGGCLKKVLTILTHIAVSKDNRFCFKIREKNKEGERGYICKNGDNCVHNRRRKCKFCHCGCVKKYNTLYRKVYGEIHTHIIRMLESNYHC